jgi:hypothetical protein
MSIRSDYKDEDKLNYTLLQLRNGKEESTEMFRNCTTIIVHCLNPL